MRKKYNREKDAYPSGRAGTSPGTNWSRKRLSFAAVAIAMVVAFSYLPVLRNPFISFDDPDYVTENFHIKDGLNWGTFAWAWTSLGSGNWHPVTWISHATDVEVFGLAPAGHHFKSLLLHAANAVLLFLVLALSTARPGCSVATALLFGLHPLNVESVAWVAEQKSLLSAFWSLLVLLAYIRYERSSNYKWMVAATGLFFIALASKAMAISLPLLLVVLDRWPLERVNTWKELFANGELWREKIPLFLLSAASGAITVIAQHRSGAIVSLAQVSFPLRFENAIVSYGFYAWKLIWPFNLAFLYPYRWPLRPLPFGEVVRVLVFLVGGTAVAWKQTQQRPWLMAGWLWFMGTLVPVIGIVQVGSQSRADRYAYIPIIGLLIVAVWSGEEITRRVPSRLRLQPVIVAGIAIFLAAQTVAQIGFWHSDHDLWLHAWRVTTDNFISADKVGVALQREGRYEDALPYFQQALRINAADPLANFNVGANLHLHGKVLEALPYYQVTAGQDTDPVLRAEAFENMGTAYRQLGDLLLARASYLKALQYDPGRRRIYAALEETETAGPKSIPGTMAKSTTR